VLDGAMGVAVEAGILHRPILRYLIRNTGLVSVVMIRLLDLDEWNLHNLINRFIEKSICIVLLGNLASWRGPPRPIRELEAKLLILFHVEEVAVARPRMIPEKPGQDTSLVEQVRLVISLPINELLLYFVIPQMLR